MYIPYCATIAALSWLVSPPVPRAAPMALPAVAMLAAARPQVSYRIDGRPTVAAAGFDRLAGAGVRALRFDRGRMRGPGVDARIEWRASGGAQHLGLAGTVARVLAGLTPR